MVIVAIAPASAGAAPPAASGAVVRDGKARFEVLTPTLIRLEYAADGRFENRATMTALNRRLRVPQFTSRVAHGRRVIRTARLTLRYRRRSGAFGPGNLEILVRVGKRLVVAHPV